MSIQNTVRRFSNQTIRVRKFDGFYDSGRFEKRQTETVEIRANVQPAGTTDLQRLPENYRRQGAYWVWPPATCVLRTGSASTSGNEPGVVADEVELNGVWYEVGAVEVWRRHARYLIARASQ